MPTLQTDTRTVTKLPDIFRTPNGVDMDIGPFDRLRDGQSSLENSPPLHHHARRKKADVTSTSAGACPRIILRDALGRELDTFTTLQEAIYRAKWKVKQSGLAREQLEWRLPKAPVPARPDLTRTAPPLKHPPINDLLTERQRPKWDSSRALVST